jgi:hypothetical protein
VAGLTQTVSTKLDTEAMRQATPRGTVRSRGTHLVKRYPKNRFVGSLQLIAQRICQTDELETIGVRERLSEIIS